MIATCTYREDLALTPPLANWLADDLLSGIERDLLSGIERYPASFTPLRPPAVLASWQAAIDEAVDNYLAVAAEYESRFTAAGWSTFGNTDEPPLDGTGER